MLTNKLRVHCTTLMRNQHKIFIKLRAEKSPFVLYDDLLLFIMFQFILIYKVEHYVFISLWNVEIFRSHLYEC